MSLILAPACTICAKTKISISCSKCCHIYCADCFGIPNDSAGEKMRLVSLLSTRLCFRCKPVKQEENPSENDGEQCRVHGKYFRLFCLSCEEILCDDCFLSEGAHMRHKIDFVKTVYKERRAETERKFTLLQESQSHNVELYEKNLESIEAAGQSILDEIEVIYERTKQSVNQFTKGRKCVLEDQMELPAKRQKLNDTLYKLVTQSPPVEFLKEHAFVNWQCDEMMSCATPDQFAPMQFDDIGCELVPSYEMHTYTLANFNLSGYWSHNRTISDIPWNIYLSKKDNLSISVDSNVDAANNKSYKMVVIVPHNDIRKTIQKLFILNGVSREHSIASVSLLQNEEFINSSGELILKIGIRSTNIVVENQVLRAQKQELKLKIDELENQLSSPERDINCKFYIMHYNLNFSKQSKKHQVAHHSANLLDRSNRRWCLRVYPMDVAKTNTNLKAYIVLRKGARTKCRYFIELMHDNPRNNVLLCAESFFESLNTGYGWNAFIDRKKLLSDVGYYPNGVLRFRFGVHPINK
ncbi:uncharacterized protein LOC129778844 [Toxorhynchites rutilus septentrionalis]|uniref:uncharacterized protein LOC129778844 n=1 Tax=Toxorhynchites rutilus septentrionalis TaxID=329112 RepID=UPI00247A363A|nr:uncharacterized protein LOC129778844 [Toxorhynchites rutilus septentrionalis]